MNNLNEQTGLLSKRIPLHYIVLFFILILSLFLCLFHFSGYYNSDDNGYLDGAMGILGLSKFSIQSLGPTRLGLTVPGAFVYWITDGNIFLTILHYIIYPSILVLIAYKITVIVSDKKTALLASFLVAINPIYYIYAGSLLPDNLLSLWGGVSLLLLIKAFKIKANPQKNSIVVFQLLCLCIGLSIGLGYLVKETALILFVPVVVSLIINERRPASYQLLGGILSVALGILIVIVLETFILYLLSGEINLRLMISQNAVTIEALKERISKQGIYPWERVMFLWSRMIPFLGWLFPVIITTLVIYPFIGLQEKDGWKRSACWAIYLFGLWTSLYLTFGSTNPFKYIPPPIQHQRYYSFAFFSCLILLAHLLMLLYYKISDIIPQKLLSLRYVISFLLVGIIIIWGTDRFVYFLTDAGSIYRTYETKSLLECYRKALNYNNKKLPIVISEYPSRRFYPLFKNLKQKSRIFLTKYGNELSRPNAPHPPFLFITLFNDHYNDNIRDKLMLSSDITMTSLYGNECLVPRGRINELKYYLYPFRSDFNQPKIEYAPKRRCFQLLLVEPSLYKTIKFNQLIDTMHVYPYKKNDIGNFYYEFIDNDLIVNLKNAKDIRVTTGKGKYHQFPNKKMESSLSLKDEPVYVNIDMEVKSEGDAKVSRADFVIFNKERKVQNTISINMLEIGKNLKQINGRILVNPEKNETAYRIMLGLSGSGKLTIMSTSNPD